MQFQYHPRAIVGRGFQGVVSKWLRREALFIVIRDASKDESRKKDARAFIKRCCQLGSRALAASGSRGIVDGIGSFLAPESFGRKVKWKHSAAFPRQAAICPRVESPPWQGEMIGGPPHGHPVSERETSLEHSEADLALRSGVENRTAHSSVGPAEPVPCHRYNSPVNRCAREALVGAPRTPILRSWESFPASPLPCGSSP